jgi:hypothetical protein
MKASWREGCENPRYLRDILTPGGFEQTDEAGPDAGMTTPRQITYMLAKYAKKHPGTDLSVFEIPQVPGYRRISRPNKSVAASLMISGYAVPLTLTLMNPNLAGAIFVDYLVRGRYPLIPEHPSTLAPERLAELTGGEQVVQNPAGAGVQSGSAISAVRQSSGSAASPGLKAIVDAHE